jgi:hypothetical protein
VPVVPKLIVVPGTARTNHPAAGKTSKRVQTAVAGRKRKRFVVGRKMDAVIMERAGMGAAIVGRRPHAVLRKRSISQPVILERTKASGVVMLERITAAKRRMIVASRRRTTRRVLMLVSCLGSHCKLLLIIYVFQILLACAVSTCSSMSLVSMVSLLTNSSYVQYLILVSWSLHSVCSRCEPEVSGSLEYLESCIVSS